MGWPCYKNGRKPIEFAVHNVDSKRSHMEIQPAEYKMT